MKNMEKRPAETPEEKMQDILMDLMYEAAFNSAKEQGIITDEVSLEEFKKTKLRDILAKLKEKGIDHFEIKL